MKNLKWFLLLLYSSSKMNLFYCCWFSIAFNACCLLKSITFILSATILSNFGNKHDAIGSRLCNVFLDLPQFCWCYHMFFNHFLLTDQKGFLHKSQHCILLVLQLEENIACNLFYVHYFRTIKSKSLFTTRLKIGFLSVLILLIDIYSSQLFF